MIEEAFYETAGFSISETRSLIQGIALCTFYLWGGWVIFNYYHSMRNSDEAPELLYAAVKVCVVIMVGSYFVL